MRRSSHRRRLPVALCLVGWFAPSAALAEPPSDPGSQPEPPAHGARARRGLGVDELGLVWTPRVILRRDQLSSPLPRRGPAVGATALRYDRTRGANANRIEVDLAIATLRSQPDFEYLEWPDGDPAMTTGSPHIYVRVRYAYLRELPLASERNKHLALRVGPGLDFDIQKFEFVHNPLILGGYHGLFALDLRAELELQPAPRHRLRLSVAAPLLAWVTRSPYAITDDDSIHANRDHNGLRTFFRYLADGAVQSWGRLQAARLDLRYDIELHPHLALSLGVHGRVLANAVPRPLLLQEYGGSLGLTARF